VKSNPESILKYSLDTNQGAVFRVAINWVSVEILARLKNSFIGMSCQQYYWFWIV